MNKDEQKILNFIKIFPLTIICFSIIVTYLIISDNNNKFEFEIEKLQTESKNQKKELIKNEVKRVYQFIENEENETIERIKSNIKQHVHDAHTIATSIYTNNKNKPKDEVIKIIKDALRDIRFNDNRGYLFIYDTNGKNILHPILTHLEGTNLYDYQDTKGTYVIRELIKIAKDKTEGFLSWWWTKPNDQKSEYHKIGFSKSFAPYNWLIGTGEYVEDYKKALKESLLTKINRMRYGNNGYMFVVNEKGLYLSHFSKEFLGKNRINLKDENGFMITKEVIRTSQKKEGGYISYMGMINPSTQKADEKISYIMGYKSWKWAIGTGVYLVDIEEIISQKRKKLEERNKEQIITIFITSSIIVTLLFFLSVLFSNMIKKKFIVYRYKIKEKTRELENTNRSLEQKVEERTKELKELAIRDPLTNLYNRRYLTEVSQDLLLLAKRNNTPLSVLMIDIDNFKNVNDTYGHDIGDKVIKLLAEKLIQQVRDSDVISRIGGEEFAVILPNVAINYAKNKAEKIRKEIELIKINIKDNITLSFTISIGISTFDLIRNSNFEDLLKESDKALYKAKESGRNNVIIYSK